MVEKRSISIPEEVHTAGLARAKRLGFTSFSAYVQHLLRRDIEAADALKEPEAEYQASGALTEAIRQQTRAISDLISVIKPGRDKPDNPSE